MTCVLPPVTPNSHPWNIVTMVPCAARFRLQAPLLSPDQQFEAFLVILDQYLLPTSPDEVNIEAKMSKRMASFRKRYTILRPRVRVDYYQKRVHQDRILQTPCTLTPLCALGMQRQYVASVTIRCEYTFFSGSQAPILQQ